MYNRYVDGLATPMPVDNEVFDSMGKVIAVRGYQRGEQEGSGE